MVIYGVTNKKDGKCLKKLVSWKNHYLLDMWMSIVLNNDNDNEGLLIEFEEAIYDLENDCQEAIKFLQNHVTEHRVHISDNEDLVGEWEYKWDREIPFNPFFRHNFRFYLGRYGVDGFVNYLKTILDFIKEYQKKYEVFIYEIG